MKYICKKFISGLTVGAMYTEQANNTGFFNARIINDEGESQMVVRNEFFNLIGEEK